MSEKCQISERKPMSRLRKAYMAKLVGRCAILIGCIVLYIMKPSEFELLNRFQFFSRFSVLHILWGLWVIDMVHQLTPIKKRLPLGSQKLFKLHFKPIRDRINHKELRKYIVSTTNAAYKVMLLWVALLVGIGILRYFRVVDNGILFLISTAFYVCDLICVLIWCPFRLILKNRCCTTCRIFNWDHLMMFSPMVFILGFYSLSLVLLSFAVWLVWELCVILYPERFWEHSNVALRCSECTDKLCTQYCQRLRN